MTFHDFSRLLQSETKDPMSRAMRLVRSRLTAEKRRHVLLNQEELGWGPWEVPPGGGGQHLMEPERI